MQSSRYKFLEVTWKGKKRVHGVKTIGNPVYHHVAHFQFPHAGDLQQAHISAWDKMKDLWKLKGFLFS